MREYVRIVIVGEKCVGKSTLIHTFISKTFHDDVPSVLADTTQTTDNGVILTIHDSSCDSGDEEVLRSKIQISDCVIVLYDVNSLDTLNKVEEFWLPQIQKLKAHQPNTVVLICGTKTDLFSGAHCSQQQEDDQLKRIMEQYEFVSSAFRCSAKEIDVDSVFHHAEISVIFPIKSIIFDFSRFRFEKNALNCFLRIFRIFDINQDGLLNDQELCNVQSVCFDNKAEELTPADRDALKKQIREFCDRNTINAEGIKNNMITFDGFLAMLAIFIENNQFQVPWTMLWKCGYTDDLSLQISPDLLIPPHCNMYENTELSLASYSFLKNIAISAASNTLVSNSKLALTPSASPSSSDDTLMEAQELLLQGQSSLTESTILPDNASAELDRTQSFAHPVGSAALPASSSTQNRMSKDRLTREAINNIFKVVDPDIEHPWKVSHRSHEQNSDSRKSAHKGNSLFRTSSYFQSSSSDTMLLTSNTPQEVNSLLWGKESFEEEELIREQIEGEQLSDLNQQSNHANNVDVIDAIHRPPDSHTNPHASQIESFPQSHSPGDAYFDMMIRRHEKGEPYPVNEWLAQWQILAMYRPVSVQMLLYMLGFSFRGNDFGITVVGKNSLRSCLKVGLFGAKGVGKTEFVVAVSQLDDWDQQHLEIANTEQTTESTELAQMQDKPVESSNDNILKIGGCLLSKTKMKTILSISRKSSRGGAQLRHDYFVIFEIIPESLAKLWIENNHESTDVAVLMLTASDLASESIASESTGNSVTVARYLESLLPLTLPRMYVGSKCDLAVCPLTEKQLNSPSTNRPTATGVSKTQINSESQGLMEHLRSESLPPIIYTSNISKQGIKDVLVGVVNVALYPESGLPKPAKKSTRLFGWSHFTQFIVVTAVGVGVGVAIIYALTECGKDSHHKRSVKKLPRHSILYAAKVVGCTVS